MDCYRSSNNNSSKKTVELPISAPLFEGHLYLRQEGKWLWRMFRFDGTTLTCLSEKKFKLPPSTPLHRLPGTESCTSLLLATPKDKNVRITQSIPTFQTQPPQVSYYQLPKWTVDMVNVSSISILKHDDNNNNNNNNNNNSNSHSSKLRSAFLLSPSSSKKSKTFCIRTFQGERLVMRAHKHQDLERWLFVLTKMWKFAQSIRQLGTQIVTNEATLNKKIPNDGDHHHMMYHNYYSSDNNINNNNNNNNNNSSSNNPPLFLERKMRNGGGGGGGEEEVVVVVGNEGVPPQMSNGSQNDRSYPLPPPQSQQHPILPEEKVNWIRAWAQSLGELSVYDEEIKSEPSLKEENLLESYPVQPKAYPLDSNQYLVAHNNNRQRRSKPHMYANHNNMMNEETSFGFPCTHYFQDTNTEDDDESNHASNNRNDVLLTYHSSIKGKNIKFGSTGALNTMIKDDNAKTENPIPALFEFNKLSIDSSPLEKLGAYPKQQQHKRNTHSFQPSIRPYHCNKRASAYMNHDEQGDGDDDDDDENMSLAEVKQFLKDKYTQPQTQITNTTVH